MRVNDGMGAMEVPNSCMMVSSRKDNFVFNRSFWTVDVYSSQDNRSSIPGFTHPSVRAPMFVQVAQYETI